MGRCAAIRALPPLTKGYWRLGAKFGLRAIVDERFGTTDVFGGLPLAEAEPRHRSRLDRKGVAALLAA